MNESLKYKNPDLFEIIKNETNEKVELLKAKDGNFTLKYDDKYLHSYYKPVEEAKKILSNIDLEKKDIVFNFGIGLGYLAKEIINIKSENIKVVLIEPSIAIIKEFLKLNEELINRKNVYIFHISQKEEIIKTLEQFFRIGYSVDYEIVKNSLSQKMFSKEFDLFMEILRDLTSFQLVHTYTLFSFSKQWHKNSFKNLEYFIESYGALDFFNIFKNKAAIVVSAGPSLDKNVKYLHWIKGKAPIIAVGTAVKKLKLENIEPDFIVSMDGGEPNWEHFKNMEYGHIPLVYEPMISPKILKYHKGKKICFISKNIVGDWAERSTEKKGEIKIGGSVALSAYDFAVKTGANPVVLIGQDLAYTYGQTHTSGTYYENDKLNKERVYVQMVEDIFGRELSSDVKFITFLKSFNQFVKEDKKNKEDFIVIDATEGGAKIKGTKVMTLRSVYRTYIKDSLSNVKEIIEAVENKSEKSKMYKKFKISKEALEEENLDFLKTVNKGVKEIKEIISKKKYNKLTQLDIIDEEIKQKYEVSFMLTFLAQKIVSYIMNENKKAESLEKSLEKTEKLYKGLKDVGEFNLNCIKAINIDKIEKNIL